VTNRHNGRCTCPDCGHEHPKAAAETCQMHGCHYAARYDGWCKWCMLALEPGRVVADFPELERIA
jgi:hypothetical protein